jgi:hypothetical protein
MKHSSIPELTGSLYQGWYLQKESQTEMLDTADYVA